MPLKKNVGRGVICFFIFLVTHGLGGRNAHSNTPLLPVPTFFSSQSRVLATRPDGVKPGSIFIKNDQVAFLEETGQGSFVVLNGIKQKTYDKIHTGITTRPLFSPDGKKFAYVGTQGKKDFAVVNGKEEGPYDAVLGLKFSPIGSDLVYIALQGKAFLVVVNGHGIHRNELNMMILDKGPVWSPDGKKIALAASVDRKEFIIANQQKGKMYTSVYKPLFSPDGQKLAYPAKLEYNDGFPMVMVLNGREGKAYDFVSDHLVSFSPNGQTLAYFASEKGKNILVVNGEEQKYTSTSTEFTQLYVSPDSQKIFYTVADKNNKQAAVIDQKMGKVYDFVFTAPLYTMPFGYNIPWTPFSPDSRQVAYVAKVGAKQFIVQNDQEGKPYDLVLFPKFSPDSQKLAYTAFQDKKMRVVVNGQESEPYSKVEVLSLKFSPDSQSFAYEASQEEGKSFVTINGRKGKSYDVVGSLQFSPDSQQIGYYTFSGKEIGWVVEDVKQ